MIEISFVRPRVGDEFLAPLPRIRDGRFHLNPLKPGLGSKLLPFLPQFGLTLFKPIRIRKADSHRPSEFKDEAIVIK